jgi:hypothetical protein
MNKTPSELDFLELLKDKQALRRDMRMIECRYFVNEAIHIGGPKERLQVNAHGIVGEIVPLVERMIKERGATDIQVRFEGDPEESWFDF